MRRRRQATQQIHASRIIHAVLLGKEGVGKSALAMRFITRRFIGEYDSQLEGTYRHHLDVDGRFVTLDVMDTAGANTKKKLDMCVQFGDLFFVLYSTTDRTSFQEAAMVARKIVQNRFFQTNATLLLIATKTDLEHLKAVHEYEGRFLAHDLDCDFFQVSVSEGYEQTHEVLKNAVRLCLSRLEMDKAKGSALSRVKEGLIGTARSLSRKKSSSSESFFDACPPSPSSPSASSVRRLSDHHV